MSDFYKGLISAPTEMTSLTEIKARLAAIEQAQDVLCERLDAIRKQQEDDGIVADAWKETLSLWQKSLAKKLDCLQAKELLSQFKAKPKRRRK